MQSLVVIKQGLYKDLADSYQKPVDTRIWMLWSLGVDCGLSSSFVNRKHARNVQESLQDMDEVTKEKCADVYWIIKIAVRGQPCSHEAFNKYDT